MFQYKHKHAIERDELQETHLTGPEFSPKAGPVIDISKGIDHEAPEHKGSFQQGHGHSRHPKLPVCRISGSRHACM
jgi:hypothetical protein